MPSVLKRRRTAKRIASGKLERAIKTVCCSREFILVGLHMLGERRDRATKKSTTEKGKALTELKKKRAKAGLSRTSDSEGEEDSAAEEKEDKDDDYAPKKPASPERREVSKVVEKSTSSFDSDDDDNKGDDRKISLEETEQLRISRETLEKWVYS